jgi:hypothetical protein
VDFRWCYKINKRSRRSAHPDPVGSEPGELFQRNGKAASTNKERVSSLCQSQQQARTSDRKAQLQGRNDEYGHHRTTWIDGSQKTVFNTSAEETKSKT